MQRETQLSPTSFTSSKISITKKSTPFLNKTTGYIKDLAINSNGANIAASGVVNQTDNDSCFNAGDGLQAKSTANLLLGLKHTCISNVNVYTLEDIIATTRIFKSGNLQAVRIPQEFRFDVAEVEIFRRGDQIILQAKKNDITEAFQ